MAKARIITLEGGEGTGKSTQIDLLARSVESAGIGYVQSREPGGAKVAEVIRAFLKNDPNHPLYKSVEEFYRDDFTPGQQLILFNAARIFFLKEIVQPTLATGKWLILDRFMASTFAYQGYGGGLDFQTVHQTIQLAVGDLKPDLTVILDVPVETALKRANRDEGSRFEDKGPDYHENVRKGYLAYAKDNPETTVVINGTEDIPTVHRAIVEELNRRFSLNLQPQI